MNSPVVRFGGGLTEKDRAVVDRASASLLTRLSRYSDREVDLELSVKEREGADPKTTLELWVPDLPKLVSRSTHTEVEVAISEVFDHALTQLMGEIERREPKNNRHLQDSIRIARP